MDEQVHGLPHSAFISTLLGGDLESGHSDRHISVFSFKQTKARLLKLKKRNATVYYFVRSFFYS